MSCWIFIRCFIGHRLCLYASCFHTRPATRPRRLSPRRAARPRPGHLYGAVTSDLWLNQHVMMNLASSVHLSLFAHLPLLIRHLRCFGRGQLAIQSAAKLWGIAPLLLTLSMSLTSSSERTNERKKERVSEWRLNPPKKCPLFYRIKIIIKLWRSILVLKILSGSISLTIFHLATDFCE